MLSPVENCKKSLGYSKGKNDFLVRGNFYEKNEIESPGLEPKDFLSALFGNTN